MIDFAEIPNFPIPTNIGHGRDLVVGKIHGKNVMAYTGRIHMFEGYRQMYLNWLQCISCFMGCQLVISTNSCGSIYSELNIGDLVIQTDNINWSGKSYLSPAILDNKFRNKEHQLMLQSSSNIHDPKMIEFALQCSRECGYDPMTGPICYFPLPQFETPAEIQCNKNMGVGVVGASSLPEQMTAYLLGIDRVAFSAVTNFGSGLASQHQDLSGEGHLIAA